MNEVPALIRVFAYLSLLTVGGGMAAFPELKIFRWTGRRSGAGQIGATTSRPAVWRERHCPATVRQAAGGGGNHSDVQRPS